MDQAIIDFEEYAAVENYSQKTIKSYSTYIALFIKFSNNELSETMIIPFLKKLKQEGNKASSINVAKYALIYYFKIILQKPITIRLPYIKRKKSLPKPIDRQDIKAMLDAETNLEKLTMLQLTYSSGMRCNEVAKSKWEHIDFKNNRVRVDEGKGDKDRITLISSSCKENLLKLFNSREIDNPHIFTNKNPLNRGKGWHISDHTVYKTVVNSAKKAGLIIHAHTHRLRHSFGTHLIEDGVNEKYVQEFMGHTSSQTTEGYIKVAKHRLLQIKSPLDNLEKGIAYEKQIAEGNVLNATDSI